MGRKEKAAKAVGGALPARRRRRSRTPSRVEEGQGYLGELKRHGAILARGALAAGPKAFEYLQQADRTLARYGGAEEQRPLRILEVLFQLSETVGTDSGYARILRGAARAFAEQGYERARIEDILAAGKVSPRTFYQFFAGKHEVLEVFYDLFFEVVMAAIGTELGRAEKEGSPAIEQAIERLSRALVAGIVLAGPLAAVVVTEALRPGTPLAARFADTAAQIGTLLQPRFRDALGRDPDPLWVRTRAGAVAGMVPWLGLSPRSSVEELENARRTIAAALTPPVL